MKLNAIYQYQCLFMAHLYGSGNIVWHWALAINLLLVPKTPPYLDTRVEFQRLLWTNSRAVSGAYGA
jgi:hypothetical protein